MHQRRVFFFSLPLTVYQVLLNGPRMSSHSITIIRLVVGIKELPWPFIIRVTLILTLVNLQKSIYISR